ncbi:FecR family protein [Flexithrix dorotheae]|uniref:FecR family protein n=1 Tax=Flexithrix dorotheae TaxID=70993 RepID=UPI0003786A13|nr:FecR family protein [Flexithrix dorotheae]
MKKEEFILLAKKYQEGLCSPEEKISYEKILEELMQENVLGPGWDETEKKFKKEKILSRIELKRIKRRQEETKYKKRVWQMAASVLLLLGLGISTYFLGNQEVEIKYITKSTTSGQKSRITLRDGSVVVLNANSRLSYPERFSATSREIILEGEAYFEVKRDPDRPFMVSSGDIITTVLGTSFNIRALDETQVEVTVSSGKVKVTADVIGKEIILLKGQQANYSKSLGDITIKQVDSRWYTSWVSRSLEFELIPFRDVMKILERTYNTEIRIRNIASNKCLIRGKYENEKLITVLKGLKLVVNFDYHLLEDNVIIIDGKGCIN